jgi:hypothetical protein
VGEEAKEEAESETGGVMDTDSRVVNATVRITKLGGQGVLVAGGFILTATHCITWSGEAEWHWEITRWRRSPRKTGASSAPG